MSEFAEFLRHDQRLVILRALLALPAYRGNSSVLAALLSQYGHEMSRDQVKAEIRWLESVGLVTVDVVESVLVVTLSERGADVAEGRVKVDGVKRPRA